jgi:predicted metal-dependent hydrolase
MTTQYSIQHEDKFLTCELKRSDRKTIEISVHPDKSIIVRAPRRISHKELDKVLKKRANWIIKKLQHYEKLGPQNKAKNYVDGEEHLYLGRLCRLKIISGTANEVKLSGDTFEITCREKPDPEKVNTLLEEWYWSKAEEAFIKHIEKWWPLFEKKGFNRPRLRIKKMKTRWGSLSTKGNLSLNVDLIKAPEECIEYLVVHELCHLEHHNHGRDYHRLLEELLPDWKERRKKLKQTAL